MANTSKTTNEPANRTPGPNNQDVPQTPRVPQEGLMTTYPNPPSKNLEEGQRFGHTAPPPQDRPWPENEEQPTRRSSADDDEVSGNIRVVFDRKYWPQKQPRQLPPREKPTDPIPPHQEVYFSEGEEATLPAKEAIDLIERQIARRAKKKQAEKQAE